MAIQLVRGMMLTSYSPQSEQAGGVTLDGSGESHSLIGRLELPGRTGSKVLSAAGGGKIWWRTNNSTFANAGSTLRVGVQDVGATLEDGTFDVSGDWVGGTDPIAANTLHGIPMGSGTKTIADGDLIAIVVELVSRGGADSVVVARMTGKLFSVANGNGYSFPYGTTDTGTLAVSQFPAFAVIEFDDGTMGWIQGSGLYDFSVTTANFSSSTTPDEYAATFTAPASIQIAGIGVTLQNVAAADTLEIILYSDPYGTPTVIEAVTPDLNQIGGNQGLFLVPITPVTLTYGQAYAVAARPTTTNSISWLYNDMGSGAEVLKAIGPFPDIKMASRSDQTGAFTETQAYHMPYVILDVCGLDDGVSSGGGLVRPVGLGGGLV